MSLNLLDDANSSGAAGIPALMRILQFGDSMLPVGAFSFSNGLEAAVQEGLVHDLKTLRQFVRTAADLAATGDGVAMLEAHRGALAHDLSRILRADQAVYCRKLNEEIRTMTVRMGRKLAEMALHALPSAPVVQQWLDSIRQQATPGTYPVSQAVVFATLGLSEQHAFAVQQYGVASMMIGAALRLMKISYLDTQSILYEVNESADASYQRVSQLPLEEMATFAPVMDILAAVHVKSRVRLFMN